MLAMDSVRSDSAVATEVDTDDGGGPVFSLGQAIDALGFGRFQLRVMVLCGGVYAADAMEAMLLSFIIPAAKREWQLSSGVDGAIGAVVFLGMFVGAHVWGMYADRAGRRRAILAVLLFTFVFGLASSVSPDVWTLLVLRGLVGAGIGGAPVAFSLFAEYLPTSTRGRQLMLFELWWTAGVCLESGLAWLVMGDSAGENDADDDAEPGPWRWLLFWSSVPLFLLTLAYPLLPESARYLEVSHQHDAAERQLAAVAAANRRPLPPGRLRRGASALPAGGKGTSGVRALLQPGLRRTTLLLWVVWGVATFS